MPHEEKILQICGFEVTTQLFSTRASKELTSPFNCTKRSEVEYT